MRAAGAVPCAYSTSSAISIEFCELKLQPADPDDPVHTCALPVGS